MGKFTSVLLILTTILIIAQVNCQYSPELAKYFSCLSAVSYQNSTIISAWNCKYCLVSQLQSAKLVYDAGQSVQGYTAYWPKESAIMVVFRGNKDYTNWINSLAIIRTTYSDCTDCTVHQGFLSSYKVVANQVAEQVQNLLNKYSISKMYAMGHSRGGVLASLAALDIKRKFNKPLTLYTFGQPRLGNSNFAAYATKMIPEQYRVINNKDIVPHILTTLIGYQHSGNQMFYPAGKPYKKCSAESSTCSNGYWFFQYTTSDHPVTEYIRILGGSYTFHHHLRWASSSSGPVHTLKAQN